MPYETVRRHLTGLDKRGHCVREQGGYLIPAEVLGRSEFAEMIKQAGTLAQKLRNDLIFQGAKFPGSGRVESQDHERRISRLSARFFLRGIRIATDALQVDIITAFVFFATHRANLGHLAYARSRTSGEPEYVWPEDVRLPATVLSLSRNIGLPYETVRRHIGILIEKGICAKAKNGRIRVRSEAMASPALLKAAQDTWGEASHFITSAFAGPRA